MSFKIINIIKRKTKMPRGVKRVFEAYVSFGNANGTSIRPSKESVAAAADVGRETVWRHTKWLVDNGLLVHVSDPDQPDGKARHYYGNGHYSFVYHVGLEALATLQNATLLSKKQRSKMQRGQRSKMQQTNVAKCHATIPSNPTLASLRSGLNQTLLDPSVVSTTGIDLPTDQYSTQAELEEEATPPNPWADDEELGGSQAKKEQQQPQQPIQNRTWEMPYSLAVITYAQMWSRMAQCWSAFAPSTGTRPSDEEVSLFSEVMAKCDENTCYPDDVMDWAKTHMPPKLVGGLRSVKGLHNAVCGEKVSTTNGLIAQFKDHGSPKNCPICQKKVQGVRCANGNCQSWVTLLEDGTVTEHCPGCIRKLPQYRTSPQYRMILTGDI
jgi:hypothetical protein